MVMTVMVLLNVGKENYLTVVARTDEHNPIFVAPNATPGQLVQALKQKSVRNFNNHNQSKSNRESVVLSTCEDSNHKDLQSSKDVIFEVYDGCGE
eukprot:Awhi_evm1s3134